MNELRLLWHDYRYFPYERGLARREVTTLMGREPVECQAGLTLQISEVPDIATRLTYFKAITGNDHIIVPDQAKLEASAATNGSAWDPCKTSAPSLRRQSTRYSAHGLHEYRGKYNPQIVRAVGNILGLQRGAWVFDPFCGSGTTLLEAAHNGWNAIGIDLNPLGVLIANAKLAAFGASPSILCREASRLAERLASPPDGSNWPEKLPDAVYLGKWFPTRVLSKLRSILVAIEGVRPLALQDIFRVILSDVCREVSLQDPGDLRIRRRKNPAVDYPATELFLSALEAKIGSIIRARAEIQPTKGITQLAIQGDSRNAESAMRAKIRIRKRKEFDVAVTSPPYATAMPYIDTQRLSLSLLGLLESSELRRGEKELIGNREIQDRERLGLEEQLKVNGAFLPPRVTSFCRKLLTLADHDSHGFRRRNVPALTYKYLGDMAEMFASVLKLVRKGGHFVLLVGRNSTTLQGKEILIDTPQLLADVAKSRGWKVAETLSFETYQRYDVHSKNSIREEVLLILRRT